LIVVGAPVHERGWILQEWLDALAVQEDHPPDGLEIVLNYGASTDDTLVIAEKEAQRGRFAAVRVIEDEHSDHVRERFWTLDRYATMVRLRNDLLRCVRAIQPDFFLSCDTDMLLPPHTLRTLFGNMQGYNGVAPLTFMTEHGEQFPNCMAMDQSRTVPTTTSAQYAVFGVVLMDQHLYANVDYAVHGLGEDLGWARNVYEARMRLALCPDVRVKHVMNPNMLATLDVRIGF
jgi:hypothetical protein